MAVYASLVSLINVINRHQNPPPPYAFLKILQTQPLSSQISSLLDFVENYSQIRSKEIQLLETRIVAAAHKAEDVIEGYRVHEIFHKIRYGVRVYEAYAKACEDLEEVVQEMDLIMKDVLKIKADSRSSIEAAGRSSSLSSSINSVIAKATVKNSMVGFDDDLINLMEKLTTHQSDRLVVSVVGMGGIGKTTLATNTYNHPFVKSCFVIRAWVTISQDYSFRKVILGLLNDNGLFSESNLEAFYNKSDGELGEKLHKALFGRKYLIVLDDIWSITAWDEISKFLPDNGNGSRIMMTTRLSILALSLGSLNHYHEMKFLDDDVSWNLLSQTVFGRGEQDVCPPELEKFGHTIAKNCRGLPLAIVVIGGLLKVSDKTREYWSEVAENVSSIVNKENDEQCLRILSLSYNQLPIQLKPLFLYMAIFPEDYEVTVSRLIKLWVAEGFLKPPRLDIINKTLEEFAEEYLKDLIDRNLIMVQKQGFRGNIKTCKMHDLLRDLCLREAHKERFLCIGNMFGDVIENINGNRRLGIHSNTIFQYNEFSIMPGDLQVILSLARTMVMEDMEDSEMVPDIIVYCDLLRVLHADKRCYLYEIIRLYNSRYLAFELNYCYPGSFPSYDITFLPWNLETLIIKGQPSQDATLPSKFWEMQHLRHIEFEYGVHLSNPDEENYCVLNNLQTLSKILNFRCTNKILGRIPNIKKLKFVYDCVKTEEEEEEEKHIHYNLVRLQKLEILDCKFFNIKISLNFPPTLIKLNLYGSRIPWENINIVGSLPNLEVLKLDNYAFCGPEWNSTEGEFQRLKSLRIRWSDLKIWRADSVNFPALQRLVLGTEELEELPWGIGEIPSLELISLEYCKRSLVISAKEIHLDAQAQGNDVLLIQVFTWDDDLQKLASHNFQVNNLDAEEVETKEEDHEDDVKDEL